MSDKHGNPMIRCPEALHPLVKEFARLYRLGNQQGVLEALQHALTTLSTGAVTPVSTVSSQDVSNVLVDVLDRLSRVEKAVFSQLPTSDNNSVDVTLHTGDSSNGLMSTSSSDNGLVHTGDSGSADKPPYTSDGSAASNADSRTDSLVVSGVVAAHMQVLLTRVIAPLQMQVGELAQTLSSHLASQVLGLKEELDARVERLEQSITANLAPEPEPDAPEATAAQEEFTPLFSQVLDDES